MICFVDVALHPEALARLARTHEVVTDASSLGEASAAIVYTVPDEWVGTDATGNLRVIGCHSHGPAIPAWARDRGIAVVTADGLWRTVAEHTLALLMAAARNVAAADRAVRAGRWLDHEELKVAYSGRDLAGATLGIWGMGHIGTQLAELVAGFRMTVLYHDVVRLPEAEEARLGVAWRTFDELLAESDFLCVLVPSTELTRGALGAAQLARTKKGAVLVNTARAAIVDEAALLAALGDGTLGAAALDVLWDEAQPQPERLLAFDRVVLTPHLGGSTLECDMALVAAVQASVSR